MSEDLHLDAELDGSFVRPERTWKGQAIAPYTEGSRLLLAQVRDEADGPLFFVYAFLFMHLELARDRKNAIRLAWDKPSFREAVLDFAGAMQAEERDQAGTVVTAMIDEAAKARTEVIPSGTPGAPPGKP